MHYTVTLPQYDNDWYEHEFTPQLQRTISAISTYFMNNHYAQQEYQLNRFKFCWYYVYDLRTLSGSYYFYDQMESDLTWQYTWVHIWQWLSSHVNFTMSDNKKFVESASLSNSWGPFKSIDLEQILSYAEYVQLLWRDRVQADANTAGYHQINKQKEFWIRVDGTPGASKWFYFSIACPIKYVIIWQDQIPSV